MDTIDRVCSCMSEDAKAYIQEKRSEIKEIRLRAGNPVQVISDEDRLIGKIVSCEMLKNTLMLLTDYSLYSLENELSDGYFTLNDGSRVGVCGKVTCDDANAVQLVYAGSLSIRFAGEVRGCADAAIKHIMMDGNVASTLVFSPPGMGKTTFLRDIARTISEMGYRTAIADERHEIAACVRGIPSMDVGKRTDVLDGCPKHIAVSRLIRTMAPQVIVSDEIGESREADAIRDASRCGIAVIASAHADSLESLSERSVLKEIMSNGVFRIAIHLNGRPGKIAEIWRFSKAGKEGGHIWEQV